MASVLVVVPMRLAAMIRITTLIFVAVTLTILSTAFADPGLPWTMSWSDIVRRLRFNGTGRCNNSSKGGELKHFQNIIFNEESGRFKT